MGKDKKHKKHKRDRYEEFDHRPSSLKLILKVGNNSTPEYDSPGTTYGISDLDPPQSGYFTDDFPEKHKKSKKKKKKKDREKKHKHHKEKRHRHHRSSERDEHTLLPLTIGCDDDDDDDDDDINIAENSVNLIQNDSTNQGGDNEIGDSSQDELDFNEDSSCTQALRENILRYAEISVENCLANRPITKPISRKVDEIVDIISSPSPSMSPTKETILITSPETSSTPGTLSTFGSITPSHFLLKHLDQPKTPSSCSESGREPRTCVLKLKQTKPPLTKLLDHLLRLLEKRDPHQFFAWPVTDDIAPGYSSIITQPMDFSTIRQKIEDNDYSTLTEFSDDFKLMCENAINYNHVETVYHKAALKLLNVGSKLLHPDNLMRSLKPLSGYMRELTARELGFEFRGNEDTTYHIIDSADEIMDSGADEPMSSAQQEEEDKRKLIRLQNEPKTKFEPFVDDLTSEEILAQVQDAASLAKKRLASRKQAHKLGFLRQNKDGTTTMKILTGTGYEGAGPEKVINLGAFVGKLEKGTGQLQGFREDRRNAAKIVKPLNYGPFSSFAPVFDSRFSNLNKEETDLVLRTYGDATSAEYSESISEYTKDSQYASVLANSLLDYLTEGDHSKTIAHLYDNQCQRHENTEVEKTLPDNRAVPDNDYEKYKDFKVDYNKLRSLSDIGIDTSFIDEFEKEMSVLEMQQNLQEQLIENFALLDKLHGTQSDRLSQPLPHHLSLVQSASADEINLASQITQNIAEIAKKLPPKMVVEPHALRKAMGISDVGLIPLQQQQPRLITPSILQERITPPVSTLSIINSVNANLCQSISMEIDNIQNQHHDLENELREFLENGSNLGGSSDDNTIEQMLLN